MMKWEHLVIPIQHDKKQKDWVVKYTDKPPVVGLQKILETYGALGWELVALNPDRFAAFAGLGQWNIEPQAFRAVFKRTAVD